MIWIQELLWGHSIAHTLLILSVTIAAGVLLGRVKLFGVSLGVTMVLFVGIVLGEAGLEVPAEVLHFLKEFGLILFVYAIGLQVGPGFITNFKKGGARLNLLALLGVLLSVGLTIALHYLTGTPVQTMAGVMSGAITNTPGLGAAQQAFLDLKGVEDETIAQGYAAAYPLGVLGIIASLILIRLIGRVDLKSEEQKLREETEESESPLVPLTVRVANPALEGAGVHNLTELLSGREFVVSRIWEKETNVVSMVNADTAFRTGDLLFVIIDKSAVEPFLLAVGPRVQMDRKQWVNSTARFESRRILVSKENISGKSLKSLNLRTIYGVNVTRISRGGTELVATPNTRLQYGDMLIAVGGSTSLDNVTELLGGSEKQLREPHLFTLFLGIALGVLLGTLPIFFPGMPQPVKLGLAGGPLIVAILMSAYGYRYRFVSYTTVSANLIIRETGLTLFLACVGLSAGDGFWETLMTGGLAWVGYGVVITVVPLLVVGLIGRFVYKFDYFTLAGMMAGSTTNPPGLGFLNALTETDRPAVGYATVYPLTMFLRVLAAQLLIIFLA